MVKKKEIGHLSDTKVQLNLSFVSAVQTSNVITQYANNTEPITPAALRLWKTNILTYSVDNGTENAYTIKRWSTYFQGIGVAADLGKK
jgi:hypothetical protein